MDLEIVNGLPSVLTMRNEEDGFYLEFSQAEDALATSWKPPVPISKMAPGFSELIGMAVVQGHPCVLSLSVGNEGFFGGYELRWQRANDIDGQSWPSPTVMLTGDWINLDDIDQYWGLTGVHLEPIGDGVGICGTRHYDAGESGFVHQMLYRSSQDGISWSPPEEVDCGGIGYAHAMGDVGGRPGIAFMIDSDSTNLWFTCSSNFNGDGWTVPTKVTVVSNALSIVDAGGVPGVLTKLQYSPAIRFVRAMDANGGSWDNPYSLKGDAGPNSGSASLSIIGGRPAVALMGNEGKEAWYVRALDARGDNWPEQHEIVADEQSSVAVQGLLSYGDEPAFYWTHGILGTVAVYE
jgi:hypothetical protein